MDFDFLSPVESVVLAHNQLLHLQTIGKNIAIHTDKDGIPDLKNVKIALVGIDENRNAITRTNHHKCLRDIRVELYKLFSW
jgi:formiminoglutamase